MRDHVRIVAYLHIVFGAINLLGGVVALSVAGGMGVLTVHLAGLPGGGTWVSAAIFAALVLFVLLTVPAIIGGLGLLRFRPWARTLMLVISTLDLLHFPLGTALGVYGLVILLSDDARRLFEPSKGFPSGAHVGMSPRPG